MFVSLAFKPIVLKDPTLLKDAALINGHWHKEEDGPVFTVHDAATGIYLNEVPNSSRATLVSAISRAHSAFGQWQHQPDSLRVACLIDLNKLILDNLQDLANIIRSENGKSAEEAKQEVHYASAFLDYLLLSENSESVRNKIVKIDDHAIRIDTQALGVCAGISSLDFPLASAVSILAHALFFNCSVVLVANESQPLSALAIAELATRTGLPAGVLNVLSCESNLARAEFLSNHLVRKISLPSIREINYYDKEACMTIVNKSMLGSKQDIHLLVFDDADCDLACDTVLTLAAVNGQDNQTSDCNQNHFRIYAQERIYAQLLKKLEKVNPNQLTLTGKFKGFNSVPMKLTSFSFKEGREVIENICTRDKKQTPAIYFFTRNVDQVWPVAAALHCEILGINPCLIQTDISIDTGLYPLITDLHGMVAERSEYSIVKCTALA